MKFKKALVIGASIALLAGCNSGPFKSDGAPIPVTEKANMYTIGEGIVSDSTDLIAKLSKAQGVPVKKLRSNGNNDDVSMNLTVLFKNCQHYLGEVYGVLENLYQRNAKVNVNEKLIKYASDESQYQTNGLLDRNIGISVYENDNVVIDSRGNDGSSGIFVCYDKANSNSFMMRFNISENFNNVTLEVGDKDKYLYQSFNEYNPATIGSFIETEFPSFKSIDVAGKLDSFYRNFETREEYVLNPSEDPYYFVENLQSIFFIKHYYQLVETIYDGDVPHVEMDEETGVTKFQTNPMIGAVYDPDIEDYRDGVVGEFEYSYGEAPEGTRIVSEVASCYKTIYLPYTIEEVTCELPNVELVFVDSEDDEFVNSIKEKGSSDMKVFKHGEFIEHHGLYVKLVPQD